eukprot:scaffold197648_cov31-Tisochrysis_lutea.AAC.3
MNWNSCWRCYSWSTIRASASSQGGADVGDGGGHSSRAVYAFRMQERTKKVGELGCHHRISVLMSELR